MDSDRKNQRTTQQQLQFYISFCKKYPELQAKKNSPQKLWNELAEKLNAMRGPTRTPQKWKNTLNQWKHTLRSRARKDKTRQCTMNGDSHTNKLLFLEMDQQASDTFDGNESGNTSGFQAVFESPLAASADGDTIFHIKEEAEEEQAPVEDCSYQTEEFLSRPITSSSNSSSELNLTPQFFFEELKRSIAKREAMQERILQQQAETNAALKQIGEAVLALVQVIAKRDESKNTK